MAQIEVSNTMIGGEVDQLATRVAKLEESGDLGARLLSLEQMAEGSSNSISALIARPVGSPSIDISQLENRLTQLEEVQSTHESSIREIQISNNDFKEAYETQNTIYKSTFGSLQKLITDTSNIINQRLDQAANDWASQNTTNLEQVGQMLDELRNEVFRQIAIAKNELSEMFDGVKSESSQLAHAIATRISTEVARQTAMAVGAEASSNVARAMVSGLVNETLRQATPTITNNISNSISASLLTNWENSMNNKLNSGFATHNIEIQNKITTTLRPVEDRVAAQHIALQGISTQINGYKLDEVAKRVNNIIQASPMLVQQLRDMGQCKQWIIEFKDWKAAIDQRINDQKELSQQQQTDINSIKTTIQNLKPADPLAQKLPADVQVSERSPRVNGDGMDVDSKESDRGQNTDGSTAVVLASSAGALGSGNASIEQTERLQQTVQKFSAECIGRIENLEIFMRRLDSDCNEFLKSNYDRIIALEDDFNNKIRANLKNWASKVQNRLIIQTREIKTINQRLERIDPRDGLVLTNGVNHHDDSRADSIDDLEDGVQL